MPVRYQLAALTKALTQDTESGQLASPQKARMGRKRALR
jgi:hypothetical protein